MKVLVNHSREDRESGHIKNTLSVKGLRCQCDDASVAHADIHIIDGGTRKDDTPTI